MGKEEEEGGSPWLQRCAQLHFAVKEKGFFRRDAGGMAAGVDGDPTRSCFPTAHPLSSEGAALVPHPEPDHLGDGGLVLPQGPQVCLLLEGGDVVVDVEDVDPDAPRRLLPAPVPGDDGQGVALRGLKVQPSRQEDYTRVFVQRETEGTGKEGEKPW